MLLLLVIISLLIIYIIIKSFLIYIIQFYFSSEFFKSLPLVLIYCIPPELFSIPFI